VLAGIAEGLGRAAARWLCYRALSLRMADRPHTREGHVGWSDEMPLQSLRRDVSGLLIGDGTRRSRT